MINRLLKTAIVLSLITIFYNLIEGTIAVFFGAEDDTLSLLGFGIDSFVEVISGVGILHMVWRMKRHPVVSRDKFEKLALRITGISFFLLTAGLILGSALSFWQGHQPVTTVPGIIISSISILTMYFLMREKLKVGKKLNSDAIIADANCTRTCFYLSIILLAASGLFELTGIGYVDILGSLGIAWFSFREGKESFEKASSDNLACTCCDITDNNNSEAKIEAGTFNK